MAEVQNFTTHIKGWGGALPESVGAGWKYDEETLKYDNRPIDKEYFQSICLLESPCPCCAKMILRGDMSKHKKRNICINNR
jgi:hypothetical protein